MNSKIFVLGGIFAATMLIAMTAVNAFEPADANRGDRTRTGDNTVGDVRNTGDATDSCYYGYNCLTNTGNLQNSGSFNIGDQN